MAPSRQAQFDLVAAKFLDSLEQRIGGLELNGLLAEFIDEQPKAADRLHELSVSLASTVRAELERALRRLCEAADVERGLSDLDALTRAAAEVVDDAPDLASHAGLEPTEVLSAERLRQKQRLRDELRAVADAEAATRQALDEDIRAHLAALNNEGPQ